MKRSHVIAVMLLLLVVVTGCGKKEDEGGDTDTFSFVVYPGSRYLGQLTDTIRNAHKLIKPAEEPPPTAVYDTDASLEDVANFYAKAYGYGTVAPDATNNLSSVKPKAYYRTGDIGADARSLADLLPKLGLHTDLSKATGTYRAAEIAPLPNRPRVTVQRPYFDETTSQMVDRTIILMSR